MKKRCPKCGGIIVDGCCVRCGFMKNGNIVGNYTPNDKFKELKIYDKHFDEIYRNENMKLIFLLGPLNFSYRGCPIIGGFASVLDIILFLAVSNFLNSVSKIYSFVYLLLHVLYLLIIRIAYCTFVNRIILKIDSIKIRIIKYKSKNNEDFYDILNKHNDKSIGSIFLSILISICISLMIIIVIVNQK